MNRQLLVKIADDLCIAKEQDEADETWKRRVFYSVTGLQMLSSLYDFDDDMSFGDEVSDNTVSMQHVLHRGKNLAEIFGENSFDADRVRELYIQNGFMLYKNNRLAYPKTTFAEAEGMFLARGLPPWKAKKVSGLGMMTQKASVAAVRVEDMFNIERSSIGDWFDKFINTISWEKVDCLPQDVEWLNISEKPTIGYWLSKPPQRGFSLCRTKSKVVKDYNLLRVSDGVARCPLPTWRVENGEYYRIAIALRVLNNNAPTVMFKKQKHTVTAKFDYLLPPAEQNFIELFSWNTSDKPSDLSGRLERVFAIDLHKTITTVFERLGYKTLEVQ